MMKTSETHRTTSDATQPIDFVFYEADGNNILQAVSKVLLAAAIKLHREITGIERAVFLLKIVEHGWEIHENRVEPFQ